MFHYLYRIRVKSQFAQHLQELLEKYTAVSTFERFCAADDTAADDPYADKSHRPRRPYSSHSVFLIDAFFRNDVEKEEFNSVLKQSIRLELIYVVEMFEYVARIEMP